MITIDRTWYEFKEIITDNRNRKWFYNDIIKKSHTGEEFIEKRNIFTIVNGFLIYSCSIVGINNPYNQPTQDEIDIWNDFNNNYKNDANDIFDTNILYPTPLRTTFYHSSENISKSLDNETFVEYKKIKLSNILLKELLLSVSDYDLTIRIIIDDVIVALLNLEVYMKETFYITGFQVNNQIKSNNISVYKTGYDSTCVMLNFDRTPVNKEIVIEMKRNSSGNKKRYLTSITAIYGEEI